MSHMSIFQPISRSPLSSVPLFGSHTIGDISHFVISHFSSLKLIVVVDIHVSMFPEQNNDKFHRLISNNALKFSFSLFIIHNT
jgi:hypothetical protein